MTPRICKNDHTEAEYEGEGNEHGYAAGISFVASHSGDEDVAN